VRAQEKGLRPADDQEVVTVHDPHDSSWAEGSPGERKPVVLTFTEFGILSFLARRTRLGVHPLQIVDAVKGDEYFVTDRAVDVQIVGLEGKSGSAAKVIETVRGVDTASRNRSWPKRKAFSGTSFFLIWSSPSFPGGRGQGTHRVSEEVHAETDRGGSGRKSALVWAMLLQHLSLLMKERLIICARRSARLHNAGYHYGCPGGKWSVIRQ